MYSIEPYKLVTLIGEAVFARCLSAIKSERTRASKVIAGPVKEPFKGDKKQFIDDLEQALYGAKIISYTQGFMLLREAAQEASSEYCRCIHYSDNSSNCPVVSLELELCWYCLNVARWLHHQGEGAEELTFI